MSQLLYNAVSPSFASLDLNEVALEAARSGNLHSFAFIVPTYRLLRNLERTLTTEYYRLHDSPISHISLYTPDTFAQAMYDTLAPGRRDVAPEIQIALIERAMKNVDLNYYVRPGKDPSLGTVEAIARVINGIRADGVLPSAFETDIEMAESGKERENGRYDVVKLRELHNIYSEYLRLLGETWIDYPGKMLRVNTALFSNRDTLFRNAFPEVQYLLVYHFTEFTSPELDMLMQLGMVRDLNVMAMFDYARENGPLYGNFDEAIEKLLTGGYGKLDLDPLALDIPEEERRPFRHHMRRNLFRTDEKIENPAFDSMIAVHSYYNREEEVQGIAAQIKSLVLDSGIPPERICITSLSMRSYSELFREYLAASGIPANITTRYELERNELITALFAALNIIAGSYDRRDVLRAVTSPYLDFGPEVDPAALADASTKLRITRGYNTWLRRIERRAGFLSGRLAKYADQDEQRAIDLELETLGRADASMKAVFGMLGEFDRTMSPAEFRTAFLRLIAKLRATENVLKLRHTLVARPRTPQDWLRIHDEIERDTRALSRFMRLLDELTEFLEREEKPADAEGTDEPRIVRRLQFYLDHLRTACARANYPIREKHEYGVLVAPIQELQGVDFDAVIVCGLIDGEFPSAYVPEAFLGKPLPNAEERTLRRERVAFYQALTQARKRLVLSYPRLAGSAELVRSTFIDALLRITTVEESGNVVEFDELRVERERLRQEESERSGKEFLKPIITYDSLAEEAGATLWGGGIIPRVDVAEELIANLRYTTRVEISRQQSASIIAASAGAADLREYRGVVTDSLTDDERAQLGTRREREYSPSQLELYAKCPFKYFARRMLGIEAPAAYDVTLTPLERGFLLHTVLFRLYTELREQGALPITEEASAGAVTRARQLAQEEIEEILLDHPYWRIDQERLLGSDALTGLLEQWISDEVERGSEKTKMIPEFFEVGFGQGGVRNGDYDAALTSAAGVELYHINVRGKVDRVEIYRQGDTVYFAVADYKTGQPPARADIVQGLSLQLMIYLEVIRQILAVYFSLPLEQVKPVGGIYYRLNAREVGTKDTYLFVPKELKEEELIRLRNSRHDPDTIEELEELIAQAFRYAEQYVEGIATGAYHVTTHDINKVCRGCEYQSVCRVTELGSTKM